MKIILNIATHGDETIGHKVVEKIKKLKLNSYHELIINIANPKAYYIRKRFIDQDLNRSFPGNLNGNHEQRIAAKLFPVIKSADLVIDIHSTTSDLKDALIITKLNKKTKEYIKVIKPKYLLWMKATKNSALISNAKVGIAFEYGSDTSRVAISNTVRDIKNLLGYLRVIDFKNKEHKKIKNYKLVKSGTVYAKYKNKYIKAKNDFTPILFGEKNYKDIFGFEGVESYNL